MLSIHFLCAFLEMEPVLGGSQILASHLVQFMAYFVTVTLRQGWVFIELKRKATGGFNIEPTFFSWALLDVLVVIVQILVVQHEGSQFKNLNMNAFSIFVQFMHYLGHFLKLKNTFKDVRV